MTRHSYDSPRTRRSVLGTLAATGAVGLAGCLGGDGGGSEESDGTDDGGEDYEDVEQQRQLDGVIMRSYFPIQLYEPDTDNRVSEIHYHEEYSHWHFMPFQIPLGGWRPAEARVYNADDEVIPIGSDERFQLAVSRTEQTPADLLEVEITDSLLNFHGLSEERGELVFHIVDGDETLWTTPRLTVQVGEEGSTE